MSDCKVGATWRHLHNGHPPTPFFLLLFKNMVGPGEVDEDLEPETAEECTKYGEVEKCVIFEV